VKILPAREPPKVTRLSSPPNAAWLERLDALIVLVDPSAVESLSHWPFGETLNAERRRLKVKPGSHYSAVLPTRRGLRVCVGLLQTHHDAFHRLTLAGRMVRELAPGRPEILGLASVDATVQPTGDAPLEALLAAVLAAIESRPEAKRTPTAAWRPNRVLLSGGGDIAGTLSLESGAHLARWLTALPPNVLDPGSYRRALATLARRHGWKMQVLGEKALARLGAGAFLAVSRGSARRDAALVKLEYRPAKGARQSSRRAPIALIGKGLCFDTGGLNLKTAKSMLTMHGDMGGSAVAVGLLAALTDSRYPHPVDAWLALAENRIGPHSYTQQDVVTAADGTTIQVQHTDAEGRMVLADAIAIASRTRPACIVDFATLTGACVTALTERMSGVFTNRPALRDVLEAAGKRSGERVWTLPNPADFDDDLDSPIADVVQCLIDGKGDHIYAARFLSRFVGAGIPWVHVDLSSAEREGGLAHIGSPITGFGVRFGAALLSDPAFLQALAAHEQTP
jgi:leucyl aminopeptidase